MNLIPVGIAIGEIIAGLDPAIFMVRNVGGFVANITVKEVHRDKLTITEIPVEVGAAITDHAYKNPATVTIETGWSNSSPEAEGNPDYVREIYGQFIALQASRQLIDIITGKRMYSNMLIGELTTFTDEKNEFSMMLTVDARELILASTSTVQVPPASAQKAPQATQPAVKIGAQQTQPAPNFNAVQPFATSGGGSGF